MLVARYYVLLVVALILNRDDKKAFILTAIVGADILNPMSCNMSRDLWYPLCMAIDSAFSIVAFLFPIRMGKVLSMIGVYMVVAHLLCWQFHSPISTHYYSIAMPFLEYMMLLICIGFSKPVLAKL